MEIINFKKHINNIASIFNEHLKEINKPKTYLSTNYSGYYSDYCYISFYEWSDVERTPILFRSVKELFKFIEDSNIEITDEQKSLIKKTYSLHITCKKGEPKLIIQPTLTDLKKDINKE